MSERACSIPQVSDWLERAVRNVEALLDLRDGDIAGRAETLTSGAGPAGFEPCLGCAENRARWGYCPACGDTGLARSRSGAHDPYLPRNAGPVELPPRLDEGPVPIVSGWSKATSEESEEMGLRLLTRALRAPPTTQSGAPTNIQLWPVEREAARLLRRDVALALRQLDKMLRYAPADILAGLVARERRALEWVARRLRPVPELVH